MIKTVHFDIPSCPFEKGHKLYPTKGIDIHPGLTTLVGCNGSGKTTLLELIRERLAQCEDIRVINYNDRIAGGTNLIEKMFFENNTERGAQLVISSEGERIYAGVGDVIAKIARITHREKPKELWILMDAIGSGLSIDNIQEIKDIVPFVQEQTPEIDIFFIVATNEYEFTIDSNNLDMTTFNYVKFTSYDRYKEFILKTREKKDKRKW